MKRKWRFLFCVLLLLGFVLPVAAQQGRILDNANLLSEAEASMLEERAQDLTDAYEMDVIILTVDTLGGKSAEAYADDYYDEHGYGVGSDHSGVLLLLAMDTREWAISTCGDAIYALTDYGIESIFSEIAGDLSDDDYYHAFSKYLDELDIYFDAYLDGEPIDGYSRYGNDADSYQPGTQEEVVYYERRGLSPFQIVLSLGIGAAVSAVVVLVMRGQMSTVKQQHGAVSYLRTGTYALQRRQDFFLYANVSKTRKAENSSGGHGGGSSVHHSSGGSRHGGGHGRF